MTSTDARPAKARERVTDPSPRRLVDGAAHEISSAYYEADAQDAHGVPG